MKFSYSALINLDITSYDYNAPLTETGDYTYKYDLIKSLLAKYGAPKTKLPNQPPNSIRVVYPDIDMIEFIPLKELLGYILSVYKFLVVFKLNYFR